MKITVEDVSKQYRTKKQTVLAVQNASWSAQAGSVYGLIGPNGSGKSTMIRMLLDLIRQDSGNILIDDVTGANRLRTFKSQVGYLPEQRGLYKDSKAVELLTYLAQLKGISIRDARSNAMALLKEVGLEDSLDKPLKSFSKGMSQKVQLIAALQHMPKLAILDEPFAGLDPVNVRLVRDFIQKQRAEGAIVILCTHMMSEAQQLADHIIMFHKGHIIRNGALIELRESFGRSNITLSPMPEGTEFESATLISEYGGRAELHLNHGFSANDFLLELAEKAIDPKEVLVTPPSLEDIFVEAVSEIS